MAYLVFARKYRPQTFGDVVEQSHVTKTLANAIESGRLAHALLFSGPRGTGKTTIARILAKCVNCSSGPAATPCNQCRSCSEITAGNAIDVFEIDGASNNKVENIRELRENAKYMPAHSRCKIYIIDEVHMLSDAAFNALLKILEEPPAHVLFFFATTEAQKIPVTILSRCQRHDLKRVGIDAIVSHMHRICSNEGIEISENGLALIAREADGSIRDGLSLLDQIVTCSESTVTDRNVIDILGVIDRKILFDVSAALFSGDMAAILEICDALYRQGRHLMKFYAELMEHFRNLLVIKSQGAPAALAGVAAHERRIMAEQAKTVTQPYLFQVLAVLFEEEWRIKQSVSPKLALEMTFFRLMQVKPAFSFDEIIEKLDRIKTGDSADAPPRFPETAQTSPAGTKDNGSVPSPGEPAEQGGYKAEAGSPSDPPSVAESEPEIPPAAENSFSQEAAVTGGVTGPAGVQPVRSGESAGNPAPENTAGYLPETPTETADNDRDGAWERLKHVICEKSPALGACLAESAMKQEPPDRVIIEANAGNPSAALLNRAKNIASIENHCHDFFDKPVKVEVRVKESPPAGSSRPPAEQLVREARSHPLVTAAVKTFNGKIRDVKIL